MNRLGIETGSHGPLTNTLSTRLMGRLCMHIYMQVYKYMCIYMYIHMYVYSYVCIFLYIYIYGYLWICVYICIYMYDTYVYDNWFRFTHGHNPTHELRKQAISFWIEKYQETFHPRFKQKFITDSIELILNNNLQIRQHLFPQTSWNSSGN